MTARPLSNKARSRARAIVDLPVPVITAFALLVMLQIGTAVVSVPGNLGVFHYLTVVTLATWSVPTETAIATALVLHIVTLGPKIVLAAFAIRRCP